MLDVRFPGNVTTARHAVWWPRPEICRAENCWRDSGTKRAPCPGDDQWTKWVKNGG